MSIELFSLNKKYITIAVSISEKFPNFWYHVMPGNNRSYQLISISAIPTEEGWCFMHFIIFSLSIMFGFPYKIRRKNN